MDQQGVILTRASKIFFAIFFAAILGSIALTFYTIHVQKHYRAFTEDEVIPDPIEFYTNGFAVLEAWVMHPHF